MARRRLILRVAASPHRYLSTAFLLCRYGNACTDDLWAAWEKASGEPIKELMGKWTKQMGFPLLEVKGVSKPDAHGNVQVSLSQGWHQGWRLARV